MPIPSMQKDAATAPTFIDSNIFFSDHHLSHSSSAFFPSPFQKAIILTADGVGEWPTTTVAIGDGNTLKIKKRCM